MTESGVVVTNSGPLIALATVRQLALLEQMYGSVLVPEAVFQEVTAQGQHRPGWESGEGRSRNHYPGRATGRALGIDG